MTTLTDTINFYSFTDSSNTPTDKSTAVIGYTTTDTLTVYTACTETLSGASTSTDISTTFISYIQTDNSTAYRAYKLAYWRFKFNSNFSYFHHLQFNWYCSCFHLLKWQLNWLLSIYNSHLTHCTCNFSASKYT